MNSFLLSDSTYLGEVEEVVDLSALVSGLLQMKGIWITTEEL